MAAADAQVFSVDLSMFGDPVILLDAGGAVVTDISLAVSQFWWSRRQLSRSKQRPWLELLYPDDLALDWTLSNLAFCLGQ